MVRGRQAAECGVRGDLSSHLTPRRGCGRACRVGVVLPDPSFPPRLDAARDHRRPVRLGPAAGMMGQLLRADRRPFVENIVALLGSMAALGIATLWVARAGGPDAVGSYALLRILPWLLAVVVSGGLAGSLAYFLSGPTRDDPQVRPTVIAMALAGAVAGSALWLIGTPLLQLVFFRHAAIGLVAAVAIPVALRLL